MVSKIFSCGTGWSKARAIGLRQLLLLSAAVTLVEAQTTSTTGIGSPPPPPDTNGNEPDSDCDPGRVFLWYLISTCCVLLLGFGQLLHVCFFFPKMQARAPKWISVVWFVLSGLSIMAGWIQYLILEAKWQRRGEFDVECGTNLILAIIFFVVLPIISVSFAFCLPVLKQRMCVPDVFFACDSPGARLSWAVRWGDIDQVNQLLSAGANPNFAEGSEDFPLYQALDHPWRGVGAEPVIKSLLAHGANPSGIGKDSKPVLDTAASLSASKLFVKLLTDAGADVMSGYPLHEACAALDLPTIKLLVELGADVNRTRKNPRALMAPNQTPLEAVLESWVFYYTLMGADWCVKADANWCVRDLYSSSWSSEGSDSSSYRDRDRLFSRPNSFENAVWIVEFLLDAGAKPELEWTKKWVSTPRGTPQAVAKIREAKDQILELMDEDRKPRKKPKKTQRSKASRRDKQRRNKDG
jgi:hypothetical protein